MALHDYEVLRADGSVARLVTFAGSPFQKRKNLEAAQYVQDHWKLREGLSIEAGVRTEWNEMVRDLEVAPRVAVAWAPKALRGTEDLRGLGRLLRRHQPGDAGARAGTRRALRPSILPDGMVHGPVPTSFVVNDRTLSTPRYQTASLSAERKLPFDFYAKAGYTRRTGGTGSRSIRIAAKRTDVLRRRGVPAAQLAARPLRRGGFLGPAHLRGAVRMVPGYTRSSTRSNAAVDYSLENPVFAPQMPGPFAWDTPNRVHMWGWVPMPKRLLPRRLEFLTPEYHGGLPGGIPHRLPVQRGGPGRLPGGHPNSRRYPDYFNVNLHFERRFRALHYLWAWRFGYNNLTVTGIRMW